ncbi:MAG TPA: YkgJ family cysteine cluster protein, partial [Acidobacteria bacterium]|nr:YkgJ family cysteine cluster protein [Acidobacteriota bacterium]
CTAGSCTACCFETRLSLLDEDIARLEAAGHRDFTVRDREGYLRLRNVHGRCVFLGAQGCTVYSIRPDGCRTYPLVYYEEEDEVDFDTFCPHWRRFARRPATALRVLRSIWIDDRQAALRRRTGGDGP